MNARMHGVRVEVERLGKSYAMGGSELPVLQGVDLRLEPGEAVAVLGPSGSGKSTFMHLLGLLDRPTTGRLRLDGQEIGNASEATRDRFRNRRIGFVFQSHHLLPELDAVGNVMVPVRLAGAAVAVARARAEALLHAVGLGARLNHRPSELSGGEQQRVAVARALVMAPGLVLADEPTGNLDPRTAAGVLELLLGLREQIGSTLMVVTHAHDIAARFPRRLVVSGSRFVEG